MPHKHSITNLLGGYTVRWRAVAGLGYWCMVRKPASQQLLSHYRVLEEKIKPAPSLCFTHIFIASLGLLCLKQRGFLMQKQALKRELCPSVRVTVTRYVVWIKHFQFFPLNWEPAVGTEPAWAPLSCFRDLLQHREVFSNLLNTFVSVSFPYRCCLEGIWFIFLFPLFFFFQLHLSCSLQTPGEFVVCGTGFCLCMYLKAAVSTNPGVSYLLSSLSDTAKPNPMSCPASSPAWLGFYSLITPRCDWQSIKPQKLGVERALSSTVPRPCQGGTCHRCVRSCVPGVALINYCISEPKTKPCWCWAPHWWESGLLSSAQSWDMMVWEVNSWLGCSRRAGLPILERLRLNLLVW